MNCLNCRGRGYIENEFLDQTYCLCDTAKVLKKKDDEDVLKREQAKIEKMAHNPTAVLAHAIQRFRNLPLLGRMTRLRGTKEYKALCDAWFEVVEADKSLRLRDLEDERDFDMLA